MLLERAKASQRRPRFPRAVELLSRNSACKATVRVRGVPPTFQPTTAGHSLQEVGDCLQACRRRGHTHHPSSLPQQHQQAQECLKRPRSCPQNAFYLLDQAKETLPLSVGACCEACEALAAAEGRGVARDKFCLHLLGGSLLPRVPRQPEQTLRPLRLASTTTLCSLCSLCSFRHLCSLCYRLWRASCHRVEGLPRQQ